jgi:hypothetical protein
MAKDFESFIVDPSLLDPSIDATDLKTTTDTREELLSDVPDYAGIQFDPTQKNYVSDLYALYSGQLPSRPATPSAPPPSSGEQDSGGGEQIATPPTSGGGSEGIIPDNTFIGGGATLEDAGGTYDGGYHSAEGGFEYTGTPMDIGYGEGQVDPRLADAVGGIDTTPVSGGNRTTLPSGDVYATDDPMLSEKIDYTPEQQSTLQNILGKAGQTVEGALTELGKIPGAVVDFLNKTVDVFGNKLDIGKTLAGAVLNKIAGGPVSLILSALPEPDPRQRKLNEFYSTGEGAKYMDPSSPDYIPGMENYNTVSGGLLNTITGGAAGTPTNYGLQGAYQDRINTVTNTLQDKYGLTDKDITDIKAGTFDPEKMDVQTELVQRLVDLGDAKKAEADMLGLTAAEEKRLQELDFKDYFAGNKDQDSIDRFDTTPPSDLDFENQSYEDEDRFTGDTTDTTVTGVTRPGTGTVLGKEGIEKFDDAETDMSNTGTAIDAFNEANRQKHFENTEKLKDAVRQGKISEETYNRLSAFDATKTMGLDPITGTLSSIGYQGVQTAVGDQSVPDMIGDIARNIQGVSGNLTPEEQVQYQEIISGKDIYRDPILGMVEEDEKTLADEDITKIDDYITNEDLFGGFDEKEEAKKQQQLEEAAKKQRELQQKIRDAENQERERVAAEEKAAAEKAKAERIAQEKIREAERQERERVATAEKAAAAKAKAEREAKAKIEAAERQERERVAAAEKAAAEKAKAEREAQQRIRDAENRERERQAAAEKAAAEKAKREREAQQRIRDAENREAERQAEERQRAAEKAAKEKRDMQQRIRDAENQERERQEQEQRQREERRQRDLGSGPPGIGGGGNGDGGGCFLKGTLVTMADGSTKPVEQVDLKDNVAEGGKVFATGKFLVENLHDYKGIKVSGSHMVNEEDKWVRVENSKHGKPLGDDEHTVYVFGSENRKILINGILFTDYFEVKEQEKFLEDEKQFFKNWKQFSNEHNESNVNILNAS